MRALGETNWVIGGPTGAAARLGMKRTTLQSRMIKLGISISFRSSHVKNGAIQSRPLSFHRTRLAADLQSLIDFGADCEKINHV